VNAPLCFDFEQTARVLLFTVPQVLADSRYDRPQWHV